MTPGRVRALVRHPQYVEATSEVVQLVPEGEATVTVVLQRGGILEGRVVDTRGRGVDADVTVLATKGSLERVARTASDGTFAFVVLEVLTVLCLARRGRHAGGGARGGLGARGRQAEARARPPRAPAALAVRATHGARGLDAAQVSAVSLDPRRAGPPPRHRVHRRAGRGAARGRAKGLALRVEVHAPGRASKVVTTTAETAQLEIELAPAESLTGEIWANRRETIEGAEVVLQTEGGARHARTNKDGAFTLGDLAPGPARLRVRAKGRAALEKAIVIEARGGRRPTELGKLELAEAGVIEGVVVDGKGDPVPGARVGKDAVPTYLPVGTPAAGLATCDARGRFRLEDLPEGNVVLEAYAADGGARPRERRPRGVRPHDRPRPHRARARARGRGRRAQRERRRRDHAGRDRGGRGGLPRGRRRRRRGGQRGRARRPPPERRAAEVAVPGSTP